MIGPAATHQTQNRYQPSGRYLWATLWRVKNAENPLDGIT